MTHVSLDKIYEIIDAHRGKILKERKQFTKGSANYEWCSYSLRTLNTLKKEFALVSDSDQIPLGL